MADFTKDADAELDYLFDWERWLAGDTISTSSWTIVPSGELAEIASSKTDTTTTIWLSGGVAGTGYRVTNRIVTAGGRTEDRTASFRVTEK